MRPQSFELLGRELEHEVGGEARGVALDLFVEAFGFHAIQRGQLAVQNHALPAQRGDDQRNTLHRWRGGRKQLAHRAVCAARFVGLHIGGRDRAVFGGGVGLHLGEFEFVQVVAICDHLGLLGWRELEQEIGAETLAVALDLLSVA